MGVFRKRRVSSEDDPSRKYAAEMREAEKKAGEAEKKTTRSAAPSQKSQVDKQLNFNLNEVILDAAEEVRDLDVAEDEKEKKIEQDQNPLLAALQHAASRTPPGRLYTYWKHLEGKRQQKRQIEKQKADEMEDLKEKAVVFTFTTFVFTFFKVYNTLSPITMPLVSLINCFSFLLPALRTSHGIRHIIECGFVEKHNLVYTYMAVHSSLSIPCALVFTVVSYIILYYVGKRLIRMVVRVVKVVFL